MSGFFAPASQKPASAFKIIDETMVAGYFKQAKQPPRLQKGPSVPSKAGSVVASSSKTSVTLSKSADSMVVTDSKVTIVTAEAMSNGVSDQKKLRIVAFDLVRTNYFPENSHCMRKLVINFRLLRQIILGFNTCENKKWQ